MFQSLTDWLIRIGPRLQRAFIEGDRWKLYLQGLGTTLELTVIALIFGVLYSLTLLTKKDVAVTERGLEIFYQMRITTNYNFWPWAEINAIVVEDRNHPELIALHIGRGSASKRFFFTRPDTEKILVLAREKHPGVPIRQATDNPRSGGFSRKSKGL